MQCSIALLQETHLCDGEHLKLRRERVDQVYSASFAKEKKTGVAIMFAKSVFFNMEQVYNDKEGRYITVAGTISDKKNTILNLYAPNEDHPQFLRMFSLCWYRKVRECI